MGAKGDQVVMRLNNRGLVIGLFIVVSVSPLSAEKKSKASQEESTGEGPELLWRQPDDLASRNLRYGMGGARHAPSGSIYTFVKEQSSGSNPKFVVKDSKGTEWKVKLGPEAKPEVVASRFVWAVGYFTDEDYFVSEIRVKDMPRLKRGNSLVKRKDSAAFGVIRDARLEREIADESKLRNWKWKHDSFHGAREWNGLRVLMALINNWDLKDVNNSVYQRAEGKPDARQLHVVSDLGVSFGTTEPNWPVARSRGNLDEYATSRFIRKVTPTHVDFQTPGFPGLLYIFNFPELFSRLTFRSIGRNVPRADVRWIGELLGQLSPRQIRDAFRAADYPEKDVEQFAIVVERRIAELKRL